MGTIALGLLDWIEVDLGFTKLCLFGLIYVLSVCCSVLQCVAVSFFVSYRVAAISWIDKIIGLFCRISSLL